MKDVTQKIQELIDLLESKNASTEVLNNQLSAKKILQEDVDRKQLAAANQLSARERIVGRIEASEKEKKDMRDAVARAFEQKKDNIRKAQELTEGEAELKSKTEELAKMKAIFIKKNEAMDAREIEYNTKFKLMKEKVLKELGSKLN